MKTIIDDSIEGLTTALKNDDNLQEKFKNDPVAALGSVETRNPKDTDYWIYRIIVMSLGLAVISIIIGLIIISIDGIRLENQLITIFTAISSGAIGAMAGLLAPSPGKSK
ncbi:hypothetical protein [uncultured Chryseobacterium sp.]|uniref:hypothetical protein n=1 Tax=uncultured Chryseobacterium sp. TaxID=259322 RepID=UPI0025E2933E|nr:hypothetical protein [uncultured Chryseobacterium sp.]